MIEIDWGKKFLEMQLQENKFQYTQIEKLKIYEVVIERECIIIKALGQKGGREFVIAGQFTLSVNDPLLQEIADRWLMDIEDIVSQLKSMFKLVPREI